MTNGVRLLDGDGINLVSKRYSSYVTKAKEVIRTDINLKTVSGLRVAFLLYPTETSRRSVDSSRTFWDKISQPTRYIVIFVECMHNYNLAVL